MKNFLKSIGLSEEDIQKVTNAYVEKHKHEAAPPTELPVYISKTRLDEVLGQKKAAEEALAEAKKLAEGASSETEKALEAAKKEWDKTHKAEIETLRKDFALTEAIRDAKGKNIKAIKALIDPAKDAVEQLEALKQSDGYLFEGTKETIPNGTGKNDPGQPGSDTAEQAAMRKAVGIQ